MQSTCVAAKECEQGERSRLSQRHKASGRIFKRKNALAAFLQQVRLVLMLFSTQPISVFGIITLGFCLISTLEPCCHYQTNHR
jgi:hypothetical protein